MTGTAQGRDHFIELAVGTRISDQYLVEGVLGRPGGFGITYLARDINLSTQVAVKEYLPREFAGRAPDRTTVVPHTSQDGDMFRVGLEQFVREAQMLARLDHANVVRVRTFLRANGTAYMVMDYYRGQTLQQFLERRGGKVAYNIAVDIMIRVLDGLKAAHAQNILHRDLKPENIYLKESGQPLLIDFGAARQAVGEKSQNMTSVLTPGFAPPEQYARRGVQGAWTDIYAAASVLYVMITGQDPPDAPERTQGDTLVPPDRLVSGLPPHVSQAITRGMAIDRTQRPQTVDAFQDLLEGTTAPAAPVIPTPPVPGPIPAPAPTGPRTNWKVIGWIVASMLLLVGIAFVAKRGVALPPSVLISESFESGAGMMHAMTDSTCGARPWGKALVLDNMGTGNCAALEYQQVDADRYRVEVKVMALNHSNDTLGTVWLAFGKQASLAEYDVNIDLPRRVRIDEEVIENDKLTHRNLTEASVASAVNGPGEWNDLVADIRGKQVAFYVNGVQVDSTTLPEAPKGWTGIGVGSYASAAFVDFTVTKNPPPMTSSTTP